MALSISASSPDAETPAESIHPPTHTMPPQSSARRRCSAVARASRMDIAAAGAGCTAPRNAVDRLCSWSYIALCILTVTATLGAVAREDANPSGAALAAAGDAGAPMLAMPCTVADARFD